MMKIIKFSGAPELSIKATKTEVFETGELELICEIKSHIPVDIAWVFNEKVLKKMHLR